MNQTGNQIGLRNATTAWTLLWEMMRAAGAGGTATAVRTDTTQEGDVLGKVQSPGSPEARLADYLVPRDW